jgi:hypothetical protein
MSSRDEGPTTYDVTQFTIREVAQCGRAIRTIGAGASSMEEVAGRIVRYLHDSLIDGQTGERACSLIRFFKTHAHGSLDDDLRAFALNMLGGSAPLPQMKCLTLLGTLGANQEWNSRETSKGHRAIPLPDEDAVQQIPMVRYLINQLGLDIRTVVRPDRTVALDMEQKTYGVFHVPEALGSPHVPAQEEFVVPYGIKSVVGFGGLLPSLDMFVTIMFFRTSIAGVAADLMKNLSLNVKLAILPFEETVFALPRRGRSPEIPEGDD